MADRESSIFPLISECEQTHVCQHFKEIRHCVMTEMAAIVSLQGALEKMSDALDRNTAVVQEYLQEAREAQIDEDDDELKDFVVNSDEEEEEEEKPKKKKEKTTTKVRKGGHIFKKPSGSALRKRTTEKKD